MQQRLFDNWYKRGQQDISKPLIVELITYREHMMACLESLPQNTRAALCFLHGWPQRSMLNWTRLSPWHE